MSRFVRQLYKLLLPYETQRWLHRLRHKREYKKLRTAVHPSSKGDFSLKPFDDHRCIFVHITKTAGTSVAKSLFGFLPYHYTADDYRNIYGTQTFDQYFKFAFVRNPWDRLYSAYRYLKSGGWNEEDRLWSEKNLAAFDDFNVFIKQWLCRDNLGKHKHFWPQYYFICDGKRRLMINYLAYFETINEDFKKISEILKINAEIGRHNANPGNNYKDAFDSESRNIVAEVYSTDIELFGYDFNGIKNRKIIS